jgi:hypothetical protein
MDQWTRLAFVDVETTSTENRIAEGVVTVDDGRVERWTTLLQPSSSRVPYPDGFAGSRMTPSFRDIAADLASTEDACRAQPRFD